MQTSDSVSSSGLSLMGGDIGGSGGSYEFQMPRALPSSSIRSSFSSSGSGSDRGSSFFSPPPAPPLGRYHHGHGHHQPLHQAFSHDQHPRYGSLCGASPGNTAASTTATTTYDQLTGILTGSAECLDGGSSADGFIRDDSHHHLQLQQHQTSSMPHHHNHPPQPPLPTNSHLHNLLMCGDSTGGLQHASTQLASHSGMVLPDGTGDPQQQQQMSSQDAMELRISLEIANRVKSGEMSSTMQQWAAAAASAARTVENGV